MDKDYANYMADYNRNTFGVNVIPADTQSRVEYPSWKNWQDKPIPQSQHEEWKATGAFSHTHCDCRPKIVYPDGRIELIATFDDLREALYMMHGSSPNIGISPYILEWFDKIFLPLYHSKHNMKTSGTDSSGQLVTKTHVGVTTDELIAKMLEIEKKNLSSKELLEHYLSSLRNQGLVDSVQSVINKSRKLFFPYSTSIEESFFRSSIDEKNELFDNKRFKVVNPKVYPSKDALEMQLTKALKHSSKDPDSGQENNSLPKIFDETCKIEKNARMIVEEFFSFPDKYFAESWLVSKASNPSTNESTVINTTQENNSTAIATSVRPTLTMMNKNEIDRGLLNELLQSVVE